MAPVAVDLTTEDLLPCPAGTYSTRKGGEVRMVGEISEISQIPFCCSRWNPPEFEFSILATSEFGTETNGFGDPELENTHMFQLT